MLDGAAPRIGGVLDQAPGVMARRSYAAMPASSSNEKLDILPEVISTSFVKILGIHGTTDSMRYRSSSAQHPTRGSPTSAMQAFNLASTFGTDVTE